MTKAQTLDYDSINWHEHFYYDETSPSCLRWNRDGANRKVKRDEPAGYMPTRYYDVKIGKVHYQVHRIIVCLHGNKVNGLVVDHIDGDRNNMKITNLAVKTQHENCYNNAIRSDNKTGVTGVTLKDGTNYCAIWIDSDGKSRSKTFSFNVYGKDGAFELACEYRKNKIEELKSKGLNYTERHGK